VTSSFSSDLEFLAKGQTEKNVFIEEDVMSSARVALGKVVAPPGTLDALQEARQGALEFIRRHVTGD
jgi:hypothetical protein